MDDLGQQQRSLAFILWAGRSDEGSVRVEKYFFKDMIQILLWDSILGSSGKDGNEKQENRSQEGRGEAILMIKENDP